MSRPTQHYFLLFAIVASCALYFVFKTNRTSKSDELATGITSMQKIENDEKWNNFLLMSKVPSAVRHLYAYSETESARLSVLEGDHPDVIDHIRKYKLVPIPPVQFIAKLDKYDRTGKYGKVQLDILKNKTNGFFIECGALDGLSGSTTAMLESLLNWTGILIEADPNNFELAVQRKRNAYVVPACLSPDSKPKLLPFAFGFKTAGSIVSNVVRASRKFRSKAMNVQCLPLYSLLLAVNTTTVDFFSLDIEGNELDVLKTIPFDKVDIKVFLIEFPHIHQGRKALEDFMIEKGYVIYPSTPAEQLKPHGWASIDIIFVKKGSGYQETRDDI